MNLYQYKLKHSLDKLDKQADEVIYRAYLYELSEDAMLKNLIYSKGKSPLLITNGSYYNSKLDNYEFYRQYSMKGCVYIAYQKPFSNLKGIEIDSKISLPIIINRRIYYNDIIACQSYLSFSILNEYQVSPLVFVIKADEINIGFPAKYIQSDYMIKKYSTIDLIESLQSQEATYQEIKRYHSFFNAEELQQKKQKQIEQAYQNYETYLQKHNEELLLKSLEKDQERNNINNFVRALRKTSK